MSIVDTMKCALGICILAMVSFEDGCTGTCSEEQSILESHATFPANSHRKQHGNTHFSTTPLGAT